MALCVLWVTGVPRRNSQNIWFRSLLHTSQLGRSIFALGSWFPRLQTDRFLAPHPLWLQPSLWRWRHTKQVEAAGRVGNAGPGTKQGVVVSSVLCIAMTISDVQSGQRFSEAKALWLGERRHLATGTTVPSKSQRRKVSSMPSSPSLMSPTQGSLTQSPGKRPSLCLPLSPPSHALKSAKQSET